MAATIDIVARAFAGARPADSTVTFDPPLPSPLRSTRFSLAYRDQRLRMDLDQHSIEVVADPCATTPMPTFGSPTPPPPQCRAGTP